MPPDVLLQEAVSHGLTYVSDDGPGLRRSGEGYYDVNNSRVRDPAILRRLQQLAIPPAWRDVWICPDPNGHIQAVGRDRRGRKQYRYHALWRAFRDEAKFDRLGAFGLALPRLRKRIKADLAQPGLPRSKVLAAVAQLLEVTLIRVGNSEYARANHSFGLTTLRKRHIELSNGGAMFEFRAKSGITRRTGFHDRRLARVLRGCEALPGQRLFQYLDEAGQRHGVESHDVNAYLREAMGDDFSAKDFRTWAGTLAAAARLVGAPAPGSDTEWRKTTAACARDVARLLANTATICRKCYIHPRVFEAYRTGTLPPSLAGDGRTAERALLRLLRRPV